jgi:translation initiation factor IF-3
MRVNNRIRALEVRVVQGGEMLGVLPIQEALRRARESGLDLVEVDGRAMPPVCKILDYGKLRYEEKKTANRKGRLGRASDVKEIKLRPKTHDHDLEFKTRAARRLLEAGHSVKITVRYRGRENRHPEKAREQLDAILPELADVANVSARVVEDARAMSVLVVPK